MMALRDLLAAIEAEAAAEAARLRTERTTAAETILADAKRRAGEVVAAAVAAADSEERREGEARLAAARAAASGQIRHAHEAAFLEILSDVRDQLRAVRTRGDYPEILAALIAEARAVVPATVVRVDPADEPLARRLLRDEGQLRVEPVLGCAGGAEVADDAGATAINTVEARLAAAEPELRALIGALLEDGRVGRAAGIPEAEEVPA